MPLKLILIRHAKSAWDDPLAEDHARVLNARGRSAATALGAWLAARGHVPDQIFSSDSARTEETVARILPALPTRPKLTLLSQLYHAEPDMLMDVLMGASGQTVAMVAHNPGIALFANRIVSAPPAHTRFSDYPTAATLVATFDAPVWGGIDWKAGQTVDFVTPHDLD